MAYTAQPVGLLADSIERIRELSDEPSDSAKYSQEKLYRMLRDEWHPVMGDINGIGDNRIVIRYSLSVTPTQREYLLPSNVGQFRRIARVATDGSGITAEVMTQRSPYSLYGPGFSIEGNFLRLDPLWDTTETLQFDYIPSGDCVMHLGTYAHNGTGSSATGFRLNTSPSEGYFDQRPYGVLGSLVRLLSGSSGNPSGWTSFPVQERVITGVTPATGLIEVTPSFSPDPSATSNTYTYEIVPFLYEYLAHPVCLRVARRIVAQSAMPDQSKALKFKMLTQLYNEAMRTARGLFANMNARFGATMSRDTPMSVVGYLAQGG